MKTGSALSMFLPVPLSLVPSSPVSRERQRCGEAGGNTKADLTSIWLTTDCCVKVRRGTCVDNQPQTY